MVTCSYLVGVKMCIHCLKNVEWSAIHLRITKFENRNTLLPSTSYTYPMEYSRDSKAQNVTETEKSGTENGCSQTWWF